MPVWLIAALILAAIALAGYAYAQSSAPKAVDFHAVMPVSEPIAADGKITLGPLTLKAGATVNGEALRVESSGRAWSVAIATILDAAAQRPKDGSVPLEIAFLGDGSSGDATGFVYEARGMVGGGAAKLEAISFWLIVPKP
ncbi:MAG: hypothetical protein U1E46_10940 [Hyphomicrobiales bacterium]